MDPIRVRIEKVFQEALDALTSEYGIAPVSAIIMKATRPGSGQYVCRGLISPYPAVQQRYAADQAV